ncbi:MAG: cation:proton antiporter [Gammaproteobacteria bacterium]|uniref:Cation:proton antiporter n=1 Tax=OM182 bacterium MED-G24 TaxID=1986255 RepID=A0A2A5WWB3_9GAMM|nr:cation:proton antiporter [Gammaproteobacteria bacterium]PDH40825.1 MAG: cation:proton antiporter [OM182 bacterium MED-G24]RPG23496.1 MAG: monovalent cation/H+ antiporter subunit D family protein [Gammaproteobacteria bacterium TMED50]
MLRVSDGAQLILIILLPLVVAPICYVLRSVRVVWLLTLATALSCFLMSVGLLLVVLDTGGFSYHLGGWAPPVGIEYRLDLLSAFVLLVLTAVFFVCQLYAGSLTVASSSKEVPPAIAPAFFAATLLCIAGLMGIVVTGDVFNLFVFLEISSLATYAMISLGRDRRALTAAFQYLVLGTIGATFFLIGVGLLYAETGTLNMREMSMLIPDLVDRQTAFTGMTFVIIGLALKLAIFPLHLWLPNAYTEAPSVVTVLLAGTSTKVAFYALARMVVSVFGVETVVETPLPRLLLIVGSLAVLFTSAQAILQANVKRLLAYSSVAQIGYMVIGLGLLTTEGLAAGFVHLFNHALTKTGLFMAVGIMMLVSLDARLSSLAGLGRQMPWTSAAVVITAFSLVGIPGTAGFISKWALLDAALAQEAYLIAAVVVVGSLLACLYLLRLLDVMYFQVSEKPRESITIPIHMVTALWLLAIACIWFGLSTEYSLSVAKLAAASMMESL